MFDSASLQPIEIRWPEWMRLGLVILLGFLLAMIFHWAAADFGYTRYFFSAEMLAAFVVLALGYRWIGGVLFLAAVGLELTLGAVSVFRFFDLSHVATMTGFAWEANGTYLLALCLFLLGLTAIWWVMHALSSAARGRHLLLTGALLLPGQFVLSFQDGTLLHPTLAKSDHLLFGSAGYFLSEVMELNKKTFNLSSEDVDFYTLASPSAVQLSIDSAGGNSKTLLIVAESWGMPYSRKILNRQLQPLQQSRHVSDIGLGEIRAVGATVFAEFRELCGKTPSKLKFRQMAPDEIRTCLPSRLRQQGVRTISLHGAQASMYDRQLWYPIVGFDEMWFKDNLANMPKQTCYSFPGVCDRDLFDVVAQRMDIDSPVFMYWLTLNSHIPYDRRDVDDFRPSLCTDVLPSGFSEQLCDYHHLQVQFFERLALLLERPVMRGVDVVVVGDHAPVFNNESSREQFEPMSVPMLHFKVK